MSNIGAGRRTGLAAVVAVAVLGAGLAGCGKAPEKEGSLGGQDAQPAKLVAVPGSTLHQVILTPEAVKQVGIETTPVVPAPTAVAPTTQAAAGEPTPAPAPAPSMSPSTSAPASVMEVIPVTAVIYDPDGASWTYTIPADRTYLRVPITVDHIDGADAFLSAGPAIGTPVVSQGASELLGVEYGVGEE